MLDTMSDAKSWFAPKRFGYGAGLPIAWQGWVALAAYMAVIIAAALWLVEQSLGAFLLVVVGATVLLLLIAARTTRGGLRWRWGSDD